MYNAVPSTSGMYHHTAFANKFPTLHIGALLVAIRQINFVHILLYTHGLLAISLDILVGCGDIAAARQQDIQSMHWAICIYAKEYGSSADASIIRAAAWPRDP